MPDDDVLRYEIVAEPGATVVSLRGEVDMANADDLARALKEAFDHGRPVLVDAGALSFIDSAGFAAIQRSVERGDLHLVVPPECSTARAFSVSGLSEVIPVHHTLERARQAAIPEG